MSKRDLLCGKITHRDGDIEVVCYRDPQVAAAESLYDVVLTNTLYSIVRKSYLNTVPPQILERTHNTRGVMIYLFKMKIIFGNRHRRLGDLVRAELNDCDANEFDLRPDPLNLIIPENVIKIGAENN